MLFNSYVFVFAFLPATLLAFHGFSRWNRIGLAQAALVTASLFFYSYWDISNFHLIVVSLLFNYFWGAWLRRFPSRFFLVLGVVMNLLWLGFYKYTDFVILNWNQFFGTAIPLQEMILPLAISFFTFQQIDFLISLYRGKVGEFRFIEYVLFVTFFPHLIAGPIVRQNQLLPQFQWRETYRFLSSNAAKGFALFALGLFKKVVIADTLGTWVAPGFFDPAHITFFEAWGVVLAYAFQLYFDFSGYSDMAIGLGKMFNIDFPLNFNSPYQAKTVSEFWRRWHMTLSSWFNDHLFTPLQIRFRDGGSAAVLFSVLFTFALMGLWHGPSWNCVLFGLLHGSAIGIETLAKKPRRALEKAAPPLLFNAFSLAATFLFWCLTLVFFRAHSLEDAFSIFKGLFLFNSYTFSWNVLFPGCRFRYPILVLLYLFVLLAPHAVGFVKERLTFRWREAAVIGFLFAAAVFFMNRTSEFLYFQF